MLNKIIKETEERLQNLEAEFNQTKAKLIEKKEILDDIIDGWKSEHPITKYHRAGENEHWIEVQMDDENEAMVFMETMNPDHLFYLMDGWTVFKPSYMFDINSYPMRSYDEVNKHRYGYCSMHPYWYEIRNGSLYKGDHSLNFWCTINGRHVLIRAIIQNPDRAVRGITWKREEFRGGYRNTGIVLRDNSGTYNRWYSPARGCDTAEPDARFFYA